MYIVIYQDNHIIIICLLPLINGTIWTNLDHFSQKFTFCSKALCPRRALFVFVAPGYLGQPQCITPLFFDGVCERN